MAERPTTVTCTDCGTTFDVGPKGRIPKRCPNCRDTTSASPDAEPVDVADDTPVTVEAEWPKELRGGVFTTSDGRIHVGLTAAVSAQEQLDT